MTEPLPPAATWAVLGAVAVLVLVSSGDVSAVRVAVLGLGGLALVPLLGWLRVLSFAPVAAAGAAAAAGAWVLAAGQAVPVAFVAASAVGSATAAGVTAAWPVTKGESGSAAAWVSVIAAAVVWGVGLPHLRLRSWSQPLLFGIDLSDRRPLAVLSVLLLAAAALGLANVARSAAGREMAAAGVAPELATRSGADVSAAWLRAGAVAGLFGGWAGFLLVLQAGALPPLSQVSPTAGIAWIAVAIVGGTLSIPGVLAAALVVGVAAPLLGMADVTLAVAGLVVVVVMGGRGLPALLGRAAAPAATPPVTGASPP